MTKQQIFDLCTIKIADVNGKVYYFEKPTTFTCTLLKVSYGKYHTIVAEVIDEYGTVIAICYSTVGFVHDGREGFSKFSLTPTTISKFFKEVVNE